MRLVAVILHDHPVVRKVNKIVNISNTNITYGIVTILLHWIMAILIIGLFALGKYMVDLDYYDKWYYSAPWWHRSIGACVFALLFVRLVWKFCNVTPATLLTYKSWEVKVAKAVHVLFYILLLTLCISGYFISTAKGVGIEVFGWFDIPYAIKLSETQADIAGKIHEITTHVLAVLFILHVIAALKHHFINRDITLVRMLKPMKPKENIK